MRETLENGTAISVPPQLVVVEQEPLPIRKRKTLFRPDEELPPHAFTRTRPDGNIELLYAPSSLKHLQFHQSRVPNLIMEGRRGTGKAVALDTPIPTPDGWATMASLAVGSRVLTPGGRPTQVVWKSEPHIDPSGTFRVLFDDGSIVVCGGQHQWLTATKNEQRRGCVSVKTTTEIVASVKSCGRESNHRIALTAAWELPTRNLPIPPYVLGVWLGDGGKGTNRITTADAEQIELLRAEGETVDKCIARYAWTIRGLGARLRRLDAIEVWKHGRQRWSGGVLLRKRVPAPYLFASKEQRLALLQGLMDTDGTCGKRQGSVEFCNTNRQLAEDVRQLAASLGLKPLWSEVRAMLHGHDCGPKYRVCWTANTPVFRLPRKLALLPIGARRRTQTQRYIVAVERTAQEPVQCIEVEDARHLYLVGHTSIPTHNSHTMRWDMHMRAMAYPGFKYLTLRRTMPELRKSHLLFIATDMDKLGGVALGIRSGNTECRYPNSSIGLFGHCETEADIEKYLSAQFDAIVFDEITTFEWDMVTRISTSCRVLEGSGLIAIVRGGTNPLGISAEDVHRYYIAKDVTPEEDAEYNPNDWGSIHIEKIDNNHIDYNQYDKRFAGLSKAYQDAWRDGIWGVDGAYFTIEPHHLINELPLIEGSVDKPPLPALRWPWLHIYRVLDYGWHDPTVCVWIAVLPNGREIPFKEMSWLRTPAQTVAHDIKQASDGMKVITTIADPTIWDGEREVGHSMADVFEDSGIPLTKGKNDRTAAGFAIQEHLNTNLPDGLPKLLICEPTCPTLVKALRSMRVDKKHPGRIADHKADHMPIALGYFCMAAVGPTRIPQQTTLRPWMKHSTDRRVLGSNGVRHSHSSHSRG